MLFSYKFSWISLGWPLVGGNLFDLLNIARMTILYTDSMATLCNPYFSFKTET
jgi:hypothetical protein